MTTQAFPSLNEIAPSWADIGVTCAIFDGPLVELADIAAINWSDTVEVGEQRGASGGRVMKRTTGSLSSEASMTLYRSGARKLVRNLASVALSFGNQKRISLVGFDIEIQHTPPGEAEIYVVRIKGCRLLGRSLSMAEGTDADKVEIALSPLYIAEFIDGEEVVLL